MAEGGEQKTKLFTWTCEDQWSVFHSGASFVIGTTGRRYGKTAGMANCSIENGIDDPGSKGLWVDVTQDNILRYFNMYFLPVLKRLPKINGKPAFHWDKQHKILTLFNGSTIDFGSAEVPEHLEGFGYGYVYLNEIGIILKNPSLWHNTIAPMLMEGKRDDSGHFTKAKIIAVGTMKRGCSLGIEWVRRATTYMEQNPDGKDYFYFKRSTYDNPLLSPAAIKDTEGEVSPSEVPAEIYGEIPPELGTDYIIPYAWVSEAIENKKVKKEPFVFTRWGVDCAGAGKDYNALAKRRGNELLEPVLQWQEADTMETARKIEEIYWATPGELKPDRIMIDANGMGKPIYDFLRGRSLPMVPVMAQAQASDPQRYTRYRSELWWKAREWFESHAVILPRDNELIKQLTNVHYTDPGGKIHVEDKKDLKKRGIHSPDAADAFILTLAGGADRPKPRYWDTTKSAKPNRHWLLR